MEVPMVGLTSSEAAAVITSCAIVAAAVLGLIGVLVTLLRRTKRVEEHAKETVEQVSNDHQTNLRVESDQRYAETMRVIKELGVQMRANDRRAGSRFARMDRRIELIRDRLDMVEDTVPRPPVRRKK